MKYWKKAAPIFGILFVCCAVAFVFAGASPAYYPNPATQVRGAALGGDLSGTVASAINISASTAQLTSGTMTVNNSAVLRRTWSNFSWTNAMITALGATTAGDVTICTLPSGMTVTRCIVVIQTPAQTVATLSVAVGRTSASFIDYVTANDATAAANTAYGLTKATIGTHLYDGVTFIDDTPSLTGTTDIKAHFISSGNLNTCTNSTGTILIETELLPTSAGAGSPTFTALSGGEKFIKAFKANDGAPINNSTILVADTDLKFAIGANETWQWEAQLFWNSATAKLNLDFTGPASPTNLNIVISDVANRSSTTLTTFSSDYGTATGNGIIQTATSPNNGLVLHGFCSNGANSGTVNLRAAQFAASMENTTLKAGSYLVAHRISP